MPQFIIKHVYIHGLIIFALQTYIWYIYGTYGICMLTYRTPSQFSLPPFDHGQQSNSPKIKTVNKDCMVDYTGQYTDQQFPDHTITHIHFHSHNHTHSQYHTYIHTHHPQPPLVNRI